MKIAKNINVDVPTTRPITLMIFSVPGCRRPGSHAMALYSCILY